MRGMAEFELSVAGYPEKHPDAPDMAADLDNLKRKVDAGATRILTQYFFENAFFYRYRDAVAAAAQSTSNRTGILDRCAA